MNMSVKVQLSFCLVALFTTSSFAGELHIRFELKKIKQKGISYNSPIFGFQFFVQDLKRTIVYKKSTRTFASQASRY